MKPLKQNTRPLLSSLIVSTGVAVLAIFANPTRGQDQNQTPASKPKNEELVSEGKPEQPTANSLMSLDEMLSLSLRNNPDIRAQRARVMAAEADLDKTRLEVVQKTIDYRKRLQEQHQALSAGARALAQTQRTAEGDEVPDEKRRIAEQGADRFREIIALQRARLHEIELEMPFLLGRQDVGRVESNHDSTAAIIQDRLIPTIEKLIEVVLKSSESGIALQTDVQPWSRRLAELKVRIATTKAERVAAVQSHVELLNTIAKRTKARQDIGVAELQDVLATRVHLAEAELWLSEIAGSRE